VANVALNPALVSLMTGVQATWSQSDLSFERTEFKIDGVAAGGGYQWALNQSVTVGGGVALSYAKERLGFKALNESQTNWGAFSQSYNLGAGAAIGYRDIVRLGVGLGAKWWKWDNGGPDEHHRQVLEATLLDAGVDVVAVLLDRENVKLTAAVGFAYLNFSGLIETKETPEFLPEDTASEYRPPEHRHYGVNVQFDSDSWGRADDVFDTTLPVVSVAVNYDTYDAAFETLDDAVRHMVGGEIGFFRMLFFRAGRIEQKRTKIGSADRDINDNTYGVGVAIAFQRYQMRFDWARRQFNNYDTNQDWYGLVFDVRL
jgi:hypothetical protein